MKRGPHSPLGRDAAIYQFWLANSEIMPLREIGKRFNLTGERIRQICVVQAAKNGNSIPVSATERD